MLATVSRPSTSDRKLTGHFPEIVCGDKWGGKLDLSVLKELRP